MRRAIELSESFIILLKEDRAADYGLLLRSFVEMAIDTDYIFRDKKEKELRAISYLLNEYIEDNKVLRKNKKEFEGNGLNVVARIAENKSKYDEEVAKVSMKYGQADWKWPNIFERAKDSPDWAVQQIYNMGYSFYCSIEHHSPSFGKHYIEDRGCKPLKKVKKPFLLRSDINLILCRLILLVIMRRFNNEFNLHWADMLKQLREKHKLEYEEMKKRDGILGKKGRTRRSGKDKEGRSGCEARKGR
jgi:hypothetical protein